MKSTVENPHPIFVHFVKAAMDFQKTKENESVYENIYRKFYDIDFMYDNKSGFLFNNIQILNRSIFDYFFILKDKLF